MRYLRKPISSYAAASKPMEKIWSTDNFWSCENLQFGLKYLKNQLGYLKKPNKSNLTTLPTNTLLAILQSGRQAKIVASVISKDNPK
jgi:hypothetical protein